MISDGLTHRILSNGTGHTGPRITTFEADVVYEFSFVQPGHDAVFASRFGRGETGAVKAMGFLAEHYLRKGDLADPADIQAEMDDMASRLERFNVIPDEDEDYRELSIRHAHHSFLRELVANNAWTALDPHALVADPRASTLILPGQPHDTLTVLRNFLWDLDDEGWIHFSISELDVLS